VKEYGYSYDDFYKYIVDGDEDLLQKLDIDSSYFDVKSFKHICSEFVSGGKYENVFKESQETSTTIKTKQFVVFELTEVKKDPFLVTLILLILQEAIDTNILSDRGKRGVLLFDEFAETQAIKDMYSGEEVIQSVAILYQKIRKENGAVYIIIQDPSQLPSNEYTGGIIANSQVLMVLPSNKTTYTKVKKTFELEDHEMYQMQSLQSNLTGQYPYSEQWLKIGNESFITRLELSPEAYLAFQTDGAVWKSLNEKYMETGNMIEAIEHNLKKQTK
jgi:type IV secretory pathway VirB4 component